MGFHVTHIFIFQQRMPKVVAVATKFSDFSKDEPFTRIWIALEI